jgi:DNA-binding NarL/FixJ family response regulator
LRLSSGRRRDRIPKGPSIWMPATFSPRSWTCCEHDMSRERVSVFLADDHVMVREGLASLLARSDRFRIVGQCGNGLEALSKAMACEPDVVILDIAMPGLNGLDLCRELTRRLPKTRVLILSMHDNPQFVARALEYGASGYLLKESAAEVLTEAMRSVARGEMYLGPGISPSVLDKIAAAGKDPYDRLTTRERQVLQLIAEGHTNRRIAEFLKLAVKTVDTHRMRLMRKLGIHDQTSLVKFAIRRGLVALG